MPQRTQRTFAERFLSLGIAKVILVVNRLDSYMPALENFSEKWCHPDYRPDKVAEEELAAVEAQFSIRFPKDYREQIIAVGAPSPTLALLSAIDDLGMDIHDLSSLCIPSGITDETEAWREIGMPLDLVVIGNDCMGNKFCFKKSEIDGEASAEAPIYFWDHEFNETECVARSFSAWVNLYLGQWSHGLSHSDF